MGRGAAPGGPRRRIRGPAPFSPRGRSAPPRYASRGAAGDSAGCEHVLLLSLWFVGLGGLASGLGGVQLLRLFAREQSDLDEVERADEAVADADAAGAGHRVAHRDRTVVLQQDERCCAVVGNLLD